MLILFCILLHFTSFRYYLLFLNTLPLHLQKRIHRRVFPPSCVLVPEVRPSAALKGQSHNFLPLTSWSRNSLCHTIFTHALTSAYNATMLDCISHETHLSLLSLFPHCHLHNLLHDIAHVLLHSLVCPSLNCACHVLPVSYGSIPPVYSSINSLSLCFECITLSLVLESYLSDISAQTSSRYHT
jgi:hypothetical protein